MQALPVVIIVIFIAAAVIIVGAVSAHGHSEGGHGGKKLKAGDRNQILKEANRRLAANPKDPEALSALGNLAWNDQNWEQVFKMYSALIEVIAGNPDFDEFQANLRYGTAALRLSRFDEAYRGLAVARSIKEDNFPVNFNLGYLEYQKKQYEKSMALLRQASELNPEHAVCLRYLGLSYMKLHSYKEALAALKRTVELDPDDKESLFAMGECQYELGNLDQALKIFSHLRVDPQMGPKAALFAGSIHLNQHLTDDAIQDFELGLKHQNMKPDTLVELKYRLAAAYLKAQNISTAIGVLSEVQSLCPNYKDVPALLAKYRELNSNHNLQIYLMGSASDFVALCRKIVVTYYPKAKVKITDIQVQKNDYADILAEIEAAKWSDVVLFRFIRATGIVGELSVRDFHARTKEVRAGKGLCMSAGTFTDEAKKFVEARLIDLLEKPQLMTILNTIDANAQSLLDADGV